jgi:hypothetical protein
MQLSQLQRVPAAASARRAAAPAPVSALCACRPVSAAFACGARPRACAGPGGRAAHAMHACIAHWAC